MGRIGFIYFVVGLRLDCSLASGASQEGELGWKGEGKRERGRLRVKLKGI